MYSSIESAIIKIERDDMNIGRLKFFDVSESYAVKKALSRQIPKMPTYEGSGKFVGDRVDYYWLCPRCKSRHEEAYSRFNYCPECGQTILWKEGD